MMSDGKRLKEIWEERISTFGRAIAEDAELTVRIERLEESSYYEFKKHTITLGAAHIENHPLSKFYADIMRGLVYHEISHVIFTKLFVEELELIGSRLRLSKDIVMTQLNSLEDIRVEKAMCAYFPDSQFYLWFLKNTYVKSLLQKSTVKNILESPTYVLHLLLNKIDVTTLISDKEYRKAIRKAKKYLIKNKFDEKPSTYSLFVDVENVLEILKPFIYNDPEKNPNIAGVSRTATPNPKIEQTDVEIITGKKQFNNTPQEKSSGEILTQTGLENTLKEKVKANMKWQEHNVVIDNDDDINSGVLPHTPEVITYHDDFITEYREELNVPKYVAYGKQLAMKLIKQLRFGNSKRMNLKRGKLDVRNLRKQLVRYGQLIDDKIFSQEKRINHKHSVGILLDLSGSMHGERAEKAKNAVIMLTTMLDEMRIPHFVSGFSAVVDEITIVDYPLKEYSKPLDFDRLSSASGLSTKIPQNGCNRDSSSIRLGTKKLLLSGSAERKILIVISDGMPNHPDGVKGNKGFNNHCRADTIRAVREATQCGVQVIGLAMTDESEIFMRKSYPLSFSLTDIEELPTALAEIYLRASRISETS